MFGQKFSIPATLPAWPALSQIQSLKIYENDEFYVVRKRRARDVEPPKLWKSSSGAFLLAGLLTHFLFMSGCVIPVSELEK